MTRNIHAAVNMNVHCSGLLCHLLIWEMRGAICFQQNAGACGGALCKTS
jgi:hypothetical protein